jgi:hypothetical protein
MADTGITVFVRNGSPLASTIYEFPGLSRGMFISVFMQDYLCKTEGVKLDEGKSLYHERGNLLVLMGEKLSDYLTDLKAGCRIIPSGVFTRAHLTSRTSWRLYRCVSTR